MFSGSRVKHSNHEKIQQRGYGLLIGNSSFSVVFVSIQLIDRHVPNRFNNFLYLTHHEVV